MVLLVSVDMYQSNHTISRKHMKAHTHKQTCMISAQEEWQEPGTGAWLGGAEESLRQRQRPGTHTHTHTHTK